MTKFTCREGIDDFFAGFTAYYLTTLPVLLGVFFGNSFSSSPNAEPDLVAACVRFDATAYLQIVRNGYFYDPDRGSLVAYFPAYPLLSRWVFQVTGMDPDATALLVSHAALLGVFVFLARWIRLRWQEATGVQRGVILAVFGLWPLGLFFRMPYAESLFVCVSLAVLDGMARRWPLTLLALLAGLATAVRPVGVAVTAAFLWYVLTQPKHRIGAKLCWAVALAPLACCGLLAYMGYQWLAFGTPWAFAQTQEHWSMLAPEDRSWSAKLASLATLEPIWGVYLPSSPRYWGHIYTPGAPLFSLIFWNPILFVLAAVLLAVGAWKRWLTGSEIILGACLLAIPYVTRSYEMSMASHGRFAAVVLVNYLVLGRMLARSSPLVVAAVCTALALWLFIFTSLYVRNYLVF